MKKANIVVVGPGIIGGAHALVVSNLDNCVLYGICDTNPDVGRPVAEQYGAKFFASVDELCADKEVDGAVVCVPDHFHLPVCAQLARAGKNVLVEKPIAFTASEGEELKRICDECGVVFGVAHTTQFVDEIRVAKEQYKNGEIGDVVHVYVRHVDTWSFGKPIWDKVEIMFYLGVHDVFDILNITGHRITKVFAKKAQSDMPVFITLFTMDNGAVGTIEVAWDMAPSVGDQLLQRNIFGSKGTMLMNLNTTDSNFKTYGEEQVNPNIASGCFFDGKGIRGALANEDRNFAECILDRSKKFDVDTDIAIDAVRVIDAIFKSVKSGVEENVC